jgi:hypothetical protein
MTLTKRIYTTSVERHRWEVEWEGGETRNSKIPSIKRHLDHLKAVRKGLGRRLKRSRLDGEMWYNRSKSRQKKWKVRRIFSHETVCQ